MQRSMVDETVQQKDDEAPDRESAGAGSRLVRPETGVAILLAIALGLFAYLAGGKGLFSGQGVMRWLVSSAEYSLVAVPACLLITSRQFDLSAGALIGFSGIIVASLSVSLGYPVWFALLAAMGGAVLIGLLNGVLTALSGVPSVIVTLGTLFALRGLAALIATGTSGSVVITGVRDVASEDPIAAVFGGEMFQSVFNWLAAQGWIGAYEVGHRAGQPIVTGLPMIIVWAVILAVIAIFLLRWTRSLDQEQASVEQVQELDPTYVASGWDFSRAPLHLFMFSAFCAAIFAACQVTALGSAATDRGQFMAFEGIAAAIIGGAAVAGGAGTVPGAVLAALLLGLIREGVLYAGGQSALYYVIIGFLLLPALLINRLLRRAAQNQ